MKLGLLIALAVLGLIVMTMVIRWLQQSRGSAAPSDGPSAGDKAIAQARADIQEHGWHVLMVRGQEGPAFLYSIGLWESYEHPEILLFAPSEDPRSVLRPFSALVQRVAAGEKLKSGQTYNKVFGDHEGTIREVLPRWFPSFLGTAGAVYGNFDFPAVQLYWPDQEGRFPWQDGFDPRLFPLQPILYQDNVVLANVGYAEVQQIARDEGPKALEESLDDLFVGIGDAAKEDLLEDWRWRVGPEAELFQVTVFGDLFLKTPDGHIHWLDTGSDLYEQVAADRDSWLRVLCDRPALFFHASTLLHLRSLAYLPKEGQVYSWIHPPMLGGEDSTDNFDVISATVHVSHLGRTAQGLAAGGQEPPGPEEDTGVLYTVVTNDEKQYSIWPADEEIPAGWKSAGKTGTKQECLEFISKVWVDLRPESLRKKKDEETKAGQR